MANDSFSNTLIVEVEGSPLPADISGLLSYAYVEDSRNLPDMFVLRFRDPTRLVLDKGHFKVGAKVALKVQTSEPGAPVQLMSGEVTALELNIDSTGSFTQVRGLDKAHRLFRGRRVAAYPNMSVADVVRKVTQRAGLQAGTIDAIPGVGGQPNTQLSQDNVSDWEFLSRLADLVGAQITVVDGKLDFRLPQPPSGAPSTTTSASKDPLVLETPGNLLALRATISAAEQVPQVQVKGWDFEHKQNINATVAPSLAGTEVDGLNPTKMAKDFGAADFLSAGAAYHSQAEVQASAKAIAAQIGTASAELEGVAKGNPKLRQGVAVALSNVGAPFAGKYTLTSTRHLFNDEVGYTTTFTVSGRQERSLYGLTGGGGGGRRERAFNGLVPAIVSDARDPLKLGRVKLTFPWLADDFASGWARTVQVGAGKSRGTVILPEVGDEVLVGFAGGDLDTPYVIGGLFNGKDTLPDLSVTPVDDSSGQIGVRALVSRTGHRLELVDSPKGDGVLLSTGDAKLLLKLDKKASTVELTSSGPVKVTGMGVTVDAGSGVLELKGAQVKVTGQSAAEFTSSGVVTVRGNVVRIN